jgi:hypothetical protein
VAFSAEVAYGSALKFGSDIAMQRFYSHHLNVGEKWYWTVYVRVSVKEMCLNIARTYTTQQRFVYRRRP